MKPEGTGRRAGYPAQTQAMRQRRRTSGLSTLPHSLDLSSVTQRTPLGDDRAGPWSSTRPMNLNRMAVDIGGRLGDPVSVSAGGPRCCMAATTGDLLITGRNGRHTYVIALPLRIQYFLDSV